MKRRIVSVCLVLCMMASLFSTFSLGISAAEAALPETMWIAPSASNQVPSRIVLCTPFVRKSSGGGGGGWGGWNPGGGRNDDPEEEASGYQLYLPGNVDSASCYFSWAGALEASDGSKTYASGQLPVPAPGETKTYTFTSGTQTKSFEVTAYQGAMAVKPIFIEIDESLGTIEAMNSDRNHETTCTGIIFIDGEQFALPKMKGRGNYSWNNAVQKRPYNITLDQKVNLLGIDSKKTKKWSLLANVNDHTLLRNKVAYDLAFQMGIGMDSAMADVWMNGEYQGTYLVTPKTDSFITDDGYLIENDNYREDSVESGGDPSFTVTGQKESDTTYSTSGLLTTVKKIGRNLLEGGEETPEALTAAAVPIRAYLQDAWDALGAKDGKNSKGKYYTDYFDLKNAACMYLFQEFVKNLEVDGGSIFFHRDGTAEEDKLLAGPAWDYDNALGFNGTAFGSGGDRLCVSGWFFNGKSTSGVGSFFGSGGGNLFTTFARHEDLKAEAKKMYNVYRAAFEGVSENVKVQADAIEASAEMNFARVTKETMNAYDMSSPKTTDAGTKYETTYHATDTWRDYIDNLVLYTAGRAQFLTDELVDETSTEGYSADFLLGKNSSVTVYPTQDVTSGGTENAQSALARNSATGEIDMTGDGQINFVLDLKNGYQLKNIKVEPEGNFKNLKTPADTGIENGYRITKVTGPVTVTVETQESICAHEFADGTCTKCGMEAYRVTFDCENCTVTAFDTQDLTAEGQKNAAFAYARSNLDGEIDVSGDGQVNFVVIPNPGCEVKSVTAAPTNYKNLKGPDETLHPDAYRITKITGNLTVTVKATQSICQHEYSAVVTAPTCVETGCTTYTCKICGDSYKDQQVPALGHNIVNGVCTRCDLTAFAVSFACDAHCSVTVYPTQSQDGEAEEYATVAYARDSETGDYDMEGNGQVNFVILPDPGYELESVTAEPKNYKNLKLPDETLVENGYRITKITGDLTVTVTTKKRESGECSHEYQAVITAPTCTETGYTTYTCAKCGDSYKGSETAALGHDYRAAVTEATCTETGYTTYTCARCGNSYKGSETAALGHNYRAAVTKPTCTAEGFTTHTCSRCGDKYTDTRLTALGHEWDEGTVRVEPSQYADGIKVFTCKRCAQTKEEKIPMLIHTHQYRAAVTAPTCMDAGYTTYTCECGDTYTADEVPALGHDFVDGSCSRCGKQESDDVPCPSEAFSDAPEKGNWAHEGIDYCIRNDLMKGVGNGKFDPEGTVTRAQLVTILYRMAKEPEVVTHDTFTDVPMGQWYSNAIEWAAANAIVNGIGNGKFDPNASITREQIAAIFFRYAKAKAGEGDLKAFPDNGDAHAYAVDALVWAVDKGIINGVKTGDVTYLEPLTNATRAQIALIIMRYQEA